VLRKVIFWWGYRLFLTSRSKYSLQFYFPG
jgi:hypothetical protein